MAFPTAGRSGCGAAQTCVDTPRFSRITAQLKVIGALAPAFAASACVSYAPAPKSLSETAATAAARTVSWASAAASCKQLAPSAPCDPARPDRLLLFAALLENNPEVAAARAHLRSVEAAATAARTPPGATLTLSTEYARASSDPSPWLLGAGLDVPLDTGGRRAARLATADLAVASARSDLAEAIWTARMGLVRALDAAGIADRQLALTGELIGIQERRIQAMERRVTAGEASRAELERVRSDLADARRHETTAGAARQAALVQIAKALGVPAANLPPVVLAPTRDGEALGPAAVSVDTRNQALLARADLLKAMIAYDQAEADLRGEIAKQFPALSIGPGFTWERGLVKLPLNVGLVLPPLDLNRRNIRAAEARRSEASAALDAAYAAAAGSVDAALAERDAARRALEGLRKLDLPVAQRLSAQADLEIAAGAIDRTDWAAARSGLLIAQFSELDAMAAVLVANTALEDALRRPLSGPETLIEGIAR
ncbi:TolC family protein [Novosphingobium olei]|uniref:TolC family protein n=1 Tax=Novosphingobium olei TaxID=2728851 RepID=A0A7Y0BT23_9SPHN|nr:TolC family protein [Novosphingobium olei]NML96087.1 TolC family protein [Novosphingobium olei]